MNKVLDGIKFGFGIFLFFGVISGLVFAVGFHTAEEILSGTFNGNYAFLGNISIGTSSIDNKLRIRTTTKTTQGIAIGSNNSHNIAIYPDLCQGCGNSLVDEGDSGIIFSKGILNSGDILIGPWSSTGAGIKILSSGNIGIGTKTPIARLSVNGNITANSICDETGSNCKDISTGWTSGPTGFTNLAGYDTPGAHTFTVPVGVTKIKITAAGAGGGGGGAGGTYGTKAPSGGNTLVTGTGVNIQANGGDGGYSRGAGGGSNGGNMGIATGGDVNIAGEGAQGGGAGIVSYSETSLDGRNGGLAIQIISVIPGEDYSITVGAGGTGSTGAYGTGETGANGYVIIEY